MLMSAFKPLSELENDGEFAARHIGPSPDDERLMLSAIGAASRQTLIDAIVPRSIARTQPMALPAPVTETAALAELKALAAQNKVFKSFIGQGYHGTHVPGVIQRNILENPALANTDPMGNGWFFKVHITDMAEFDQLMDGPAYDALLKTL